MIQRLWVLGPCLHVCAQQVHVYGFATSTCVFTFVGALPMFTRLCTAGACSCVCHGHMYFRVCGCLAHVHTLVHSRCMVLCVCATSTCDAAFVGAWPMFTRLCTAGACFYLCSKNTCDFMCVGVCPSEVFYMFPRVWNHVDCTY